MFKRLFSTEKDNKWIGHINTSQHFSPPYDSIAGTKEVELSDDLQENALSLTKALEK